KVRHRTGLREPAFRGGHGARGILEALCRGEHHLVLGGNRELRVDPQPFGLCGRGTGPAGVIKGLIIFAREPIPGKVKTRLAQDVGDLAAAELYGAMLADVLEKAASLDDIRTMVFWALETGRIPDNSEFAGLEMFEQQGAD